MAILANIFVEEVGQYYFDNIIEVQQFVHIPYLVEYRAGDYRIGADVRLDKICPHLKEGDSIIRIIMSCN